MTTLFSIEELKGLAAKTGASFFQDNHDTIRLVFDCKGIKYTEMYFGSAEKGFRKHYN